MSVIQGHVKMAGTCSDAINGYTCNCATGFYGDTCSLGMVKSLEIVNFWRLRM